MEGTKDALPVESRSWVSGALVTTYTLLSYRGEAGEQFQVGPLGDHDEPYEGSFWQRVLERRQGMALSEQSQAVYRRLLVLRSKVRASLERGLVDLAS